MELSGDDEPMGLRMGKMNGGVASMCSQGNLAGTMLGISFSLGLFHCLVERCSFDGMTLMGSPRS